LSSSAIRVGTRGSTLALAQAGWVKAQLEKRRPDSPAELVVIKTSGDRFFDASLQAIGGKGVFTKEIEDALLRGQIDLAVHSMKDLPTELTVGLIVAAVPEREDPRDVLVSRGSARIGELSAGAKVGTGSLRRQAQLLNYRSDLSVVPLRGNVETRLKKLDAGDVDALVMAAAGLKRINRADRIVEFLTEEVCVNAVAQGALALETRVDDPIIGHLSFLHDPKTFAEVSAERSFLTKLGGGCLVPVGARAKFTKDGLQMVGVVASPDGRFRCRGEIAGPAADAMKLGQELAERLLRDGADKILASARRDG
jgi:hydroxymethylbilane synthase